MNKHTKIVIIVIILSVVGIFAYKFISPYFIKKQAFQTSDAKDTKGTIRIALDSWIGYFVIQSPVFKKLMRDSKYSIEIIDDDANYAERMNKLKSGKIDIAVATIDSYLLNGVKENFPATIIALIDESKGGDAIVAWESKIDKIEKLKTITDYKIAFTPDSPSEHLLKSIGVHFDIPLLLDKNGSWKVKTKGAKDAYKKLINKKVDVAVLWEPHVTDAVSKDGIIKILGSEDTEKLIVDILLVNRMYAKKNFDIVTILLSNYFKALEIYNSDKDKLKQDIVKTTNSTLKNVNTMLKGVEWIDLADNAKWFGFIEEKQYKEKELVEAIESTIDILIQNQDFVNNPLPNNDVNTIINSGFIKNLINSNGNEIDYSDTEQINSLSKKFSRLSEEEWNKLKEIGILKVRPINFMSGTSKLIAEGKLQIDEIIENLEHYPNFRILIKGHTGITGDKQANMILSQERANAVANYIMTNYNVDLNRIRAIGVGGNYPLKKNSNESSRAYNDRLKRVEIHLVTDE